MKKYYFSILLAFSTLSGCTTFTVIEEGLGSYNGRHINSLTSVIGYPNGQGSVAGDKLYIWDSSRSVSYSMPTTTYNSGTVNAYGAYGSTYGNYSGTSTTYTMKTVNYQCKIMVRVNSRDIITGSQYEGNIGGCERYASAFRRIKKASSIKSNTVYCVIGKAVIRTKYCSSKYKGESYGSLAEAKAAIARTE